MTPILELSELLILLHKAQRSVRTPMKRVLADYHLTVIEWLILDCIYEETYFTKIMEDLDLKQSFVSKYIAQLTAKGWITTEVIQEDKRSKYYSTTELAEDKIPRIKAKLIDCFDSISKQISYAEFTKLISTLEKITSFNEGDQRNITIL